MTIALHKDGSFLHSRLKMQRAEQHLSELRLAVSAFLDTNPFRWKREFLVVNENRFVRMHFECDPVPNELAPIIGDTVHNLRSALDLCACELARLNSNKDDGVYFPFCTDPEYLDKQISNKRFYLAGDAAVAVVKDLKPFRGGNEDLRALHELDIIDKHRSILPTAISSASPVFSIGPDNALSFVPETEVPASASLVFPEGVPLAGADIIQSLERLVGETQRVVEMFAYLLTENGE